MTATISDRFDLGDVVRRLRKVAGEGDVALHEPLFAGRENELVKDCIDSGWVSSVGKYVDQFETMLAEECGVKHAVAVVNGTAALHLAFVVSGIKPGDEVIIPTLTFVATANAVVQSGAVPHFADSDAATLGIDPVKLDDHLAQIGERRGTVLHNRETGRRISAIVPMHTFGNPVDMDRLQRVAEKHALPIIEDATESLGSTYKGKPCGSFGLLSTLSFNGNKIITTGGGGAILTNDASLARRAKHLSTTAKKKHAWDFDHDEVAWNYRLPNINAALGVAQLEQLSEFLKAKRELAEKWQVAFANCEGAYIFSAPDFAESNHWLTVLMLDKGHESMRNEVLRLSNDSGLMTRPLWKLMHHLSHFKSCPRMDLSTAEDLEMRIINIPSSVKLAKTRP